MCGGEVCHDGVHLSPHLGRLVPLRPEERHTRTTARYLTQTQRTKGGGKGGKGGESGASEDGRFLGKPRSEAWSMAACG